MDTHSQYDQHSLQTPLKECQSIPQVESVQIQTTGSLRRGVSVIALVTVVLLGVHGAFLWNQQSIAEGVSAATEETAAAEIETRSVNEAIDDLLRVDLFTVEQRRHQTRVQILKLELRIAQLERRRVPVNTCHKCIAPPTKPQQVRIVPACVDSVFC